MLGMVKIYLAEGLSLNISPTGSKLGKEKKVW
jgi:hypothetical protein